MSEKVNYGTVNNKKSGVKNRFFKYVLCLCLGIFSLFGFMPKNVIGVKADTLENTLSGYSYTATAINRNYDGYFTWYTSGSPVDFTNLSGNTTTNGAIKVVLRIYKTNSSIGLSTFKTNSVSLLDLRTDTGFVYSVYGSQLYDYSSGYSISQAGMPSYNIVNINCLVFNLIADLQYICIYYNYDGVEGYFCSQDLFRLKETYSSGSSIDTDSIYNEGYTAGNTEGYNTGYSEGKTAGITEGTTTGYNSGYSEGYTAGYDKCEDDSIPLMQENWQNGYDIGKGEGVNEGISQGYNNGYNAGLEDNQPLVYQSGYDEGHLVGKSLGLELGYNNAKEEYYSDQSNFKNLMFSIIDAPFNVLSNAFDFEIFGINMSSFLIAIVSLLLVAFVIRKLM